MPDLHTFILDTYYWPFIDQGHLPEDTPLIHHHIGLRNLTHLVSSVSGVSATQADQALRMAIQEVDL